MDLFDNTSTVDTNDVSKSLYAVYFTLNLVLILTWNPLCLLIINRMTTIQPSTRVFMSSLTVSNLGIGLFSFLPTVICNFYRDETCSSYGLVQGAVQTIFALECLLSLLLLTIDRYLAIAYCLHYPRLMTLRRAVVAVICSWVFSTLTSILVYIVSKLPNAEFIITIGAILLVLLTIVVLYLHILVIARRQARRIAHENQVAPQRISYKAFTTVAITLIFLSVCWTPYLIHLVLRYQRTVPMSRYLRLFFANIVHTTYWLDGIILHMQNKEFRKVLHRMVSAGFRKLRQRCNCTQA